MYQIYCHKKWYLSNNATEPLTYSEFERILLDATEIFRTRHECRHYWDMFVNWGYIKIGSDESSIDLGRLRLYFDESEIDHTAQFFDRMNKLDLEWIGKMERKNMAAKTASSNMLYNIYCNREWYLSNNATEPLTYSEFERILLDATEILRTHKQCREWWQSYIEWGYFIIESTDGFSVQVDIKKLRDKLDYWRLEYTAQYFEE